MRRLRYAVEALGYLVAFGLLRLLPVDAASNLGGFVGRAIGPRLRVTERARRNLRLAMPGISRAEAERIIRGMWDNLGRVAAEYPHLGHISALESGRVVWIGMEPVAALGERRSAGVLASGHLANWEVLAPSAAQRGIDITIIVREPNNPFIRPSIDRLRGDTGVGRVPKGATGTRQALEVLRRGHALGLLFDQKLNSGITVPFFGVDARTTPAPAQLAMRFKCPLVPVAIERTGPARFRMTAHRPIEPPDTGDRQADVAAVTRALNDILEGWIRARPEQWFWLHRRWPEAAYRACEAKSGTPRPGADPA